MKTCVYLWYCLAEFLFEREMFPKNLQGKSKHTFHVHKPFPKIVLLVR